MLDVITEAVDEIFGSEDLVESAVYRASDDAEQIPVSVIRRTAHVNAALFATGAAVPGDSIFVRRSEVPEQPPEGATFALMRAARTLRVRTARTDETESYWECDVDEVS